MVRESRTGRNQTTNDDVLLQAAEVITLASYCSLGENTCSLLERRCRDEALRRQRRFGNTQELAFDGWSNKPFSIHAIALFEERIPLDLLALNKG